MAGSRPPQRPALPVIISHRHRFIFFAVPKTGTHSVRQALRAHMGPEDQEQVGLFADKRLPYPSLAAIGHGHLAARQVRPVLGADTFDAYFRFAFVRNPYDRFVSYCAFMARETGDFERHPLAFMKYVLRELRPFGHVLFQPQASFLVGDDGRLAMDMVGRTEDMQASWEAICARIGIPATPLERANRSSHRPFWSYYDDELVAMVGRLYQQDLALFGYAFPAGTTAGAKTRD
jgi:hypothetical protein